MKKLLPANPGISAWLVVLTAIFFSPQLIAAPFDRFGVAELCPTLAGGREWFADWEPARTVGSYDPDPADKNFFNEEGTLQIHGGIASITPGMTRDRKST